MYIKIYFIASSRFHCLSQQVVCVSTPKMYPRSRYFLVKYKCTYSKMELGQQPSDILNSKNEIRCPEYLIYMK